MVIYTIQKLIETHRNELNKLAESKNFNFQDPEVISKSIELDKLIVTFMILLFYFKMILQITI